MASSNGSPGSSLATAEEHTLTKKDPAPSVHGLSARADGTCAVTRHEGVTLFERTGDAVTQRYVETRLRHQEVALHPTASRFAVWTKTSAVILKKREVVLFVEDGAAFRRVPLWSTEVIHVETPLGVTFVGDLVVVTVRAKGGVDVHLFAPDGGGGYALRETLRGPGGALASSRDHWAVVTSTRAAFLDVDGASARIREVPLAGLPPGDVESAALDDAHLVVGLPRANGPGSAELTAVGAAAIFARRGDGLELVATLRPETTRRYLGFGAMPSLAGGKVALGSLGWERVPASHDAAVPRVSSTSLHDTTGAVLGTTPARRVSVESVARVYTLTQVAGDRLFELSDGGDVLRVVRC